LLLEHGLIVCENESFIGDLLIKEGKICKIIADGKDKLTEEERKEVGDNVIDMTGKTILPGGIDPHVHFHYPQGGFHIYSADDFYTGSYAAVCGGTTSFIDFVEATPEQSLNEALELRDNDAK